MVRRPPIVGAVLALLVAFAPPAPRAGASGPFEADLRAAMASYYGALLASSRGDADGTLRHLIVLSSRWEQLTRAPGDGAPAWFRDSAPHRSAARGVASSIEAARRKLPRDVEGAHAELEGIRALLRDARARHGARAFDDALTEYHDAMERLTSRVGGRNEIALTASDYTAIREEAERARAAWSEVESRPDSPTRVPGWKPLSAGTAEALSRASHAAERKDARAAHEASEELKGRYFDLLTLLSRRR